MAKKAASNTVAPQSAKTVPAPNSSATTTSSPSNTTTTTSSSTKTTTNSSSSSTSTVRNSLTAALSPKSSPQEIVQHVWNKYINETPSRTLWLDTFMAFLVLIGGVQFLYCVLAGNYPFNAFLSGFCAAVGQFVLTASLRMQTVEILPKSATGTSASSGLAALKKGSDSSEGSEKISSERAFADFVFGSLILHGFCVNFIN